MIQNQFARLIKTLQREATELKTVKRLATSTLETQTKSINASGVITKSGGYIYPTKAAFIAINTPDFAPFSVTLSNEEQRKYKIYGSAKDGVPGVVIVPVYTRNRDINMADGDKTISFTVNVTSTDEMTLSTEQINYSGGN